MTDPAAPLVVVETSSRVPAGLLTAAAWDVLRARTVAARPGHPQVVALEGQGVTVHEVADATAASLMPLGPVAWLSSDDDGPSLRPGSGLPTVSGVPDLAGARLLDAVAVMDRLRSPGGCPWDAEQTPTSLMPYLLEEAYEAYQTLEDGDADALRDELGDVLLQVLFHARIAAEGADGPAWDVDDVAAGLVDKLVRRHPHVFGTTAVDSAAEVQTNWDAIKATESDGGSTVAKVPLALPALGLAAKLQKRATKAGIDPAAIVPAPSVGDAAAALTGAPDRDAAAGELLWAAVALVRGAGIDAEAALRATARRRQHELARLEAGQTSPERDGEAPLPVPRSHLS